MCLWLHNLQNKLYGVITIWNKHNHRINTAEALRYFKATDNLRQTFEEYMNDGMTMTEAIW